MNICTYFISIQVWLYTFQSVAKKNSDERIQIWILFAKGILYEYEYEYSFWHLASRIWIRILFVRNIHEYI